MHPSAYELGRRFFATYVPDPMTDPRTIVEVGSLNINGTLRDHVPYGCWIGMDWEWGPGVDVLFEGLKFPLDTAIADAVVSSSWLRHDQFFWNTFAEMARVCRPGGYIYINVPTTGPIGRRPIDAWRFCIDAARPLAEWAGVCGHPVELIESDVVKELSDGVWLDFWAVYRRADA